MRYLDMLVQRFPGWSAGKLDPGSPGDSGGETDTDDDDPESEMVAPDGYMALTYNAQGQPQVAVDPARALQIDDTVNRATSEAAQHIRGWVMNRLQDARLNTALMERLYNRANRIMLRWVTNQLGTFLRSLPPPLTTFLGQLAQNHQIFGADLEPMVTFMDSVLNAALTQPLPDDEDELRRLSVHTLHSYPMMNGVEDEAGGPDFPTGNGLTFQANKHAVHVTLGTHVFDMTDILGGSALTPLRDGPTMEFHVRRVMQVGSITQFIQIQCANVPNSTTNPNYLYLSWVTNGLSLNVGGSNISCTNAGFDLSEFLHVIIMRSAGYWSMCVSQGDLTTGFFTSGSQFEVYGVLAMELVAGDVASVWCIRQLCISSGKEYPQAPTEELLHHGADDQTGSAGAFENWGTLLFNTPTGTIYTFDGNQDHTTAWDNANTTVVGCKVDVTIPDAWTMSMDIKPGPPGHFSEYYFNMTNTLGNGTQVGFYSHHSGAYAGVHSVFSNGYAEWTDTSWDDWANLKIVLTSTGLSVYFNGVLKDTLTSFQIRYGFGHLQLGSSNGGSQAHGTQMRNIKFYGSS